jgi:hypothetical protein
VNWKRGLLRVWVIASLIWLAGWLLYFWATCNLNPDNDLYCYTSFLDDWMKPAPYFTFLDYASIVATGMVVPIAALIIGFGILWAVGGFRR